MNVDFFFGALIGAHGFPVFIGGARKLGIRDALVDRGDRHVDADADAAHGNARHFAAKIAIFFRCHVDIARRRDRTAGHMGTDAAVDVVQGDGNPDAADAESAHATDGFRRQLIRGFYIDIVGFQRAIGHQSRCLASGIVNAHIGRQPRADGHRRAGRDEGVLPVVLVLRKDGDILSVRTFFRFESAVRHFRLYGRSIVYNGHTGAYSHSDHAGG